MTGQFRRYVAEGLGTCALVAIGPGASMVAAKTGAFGHSAVALAFGLVVAEAPYSDDGYTEWLHGPSDM